MRMKKIAVVTMALALSVGGAFTSLADWQSQGDGNWKYQNEDGSYKSNTWWQNGSGKWFNFDANGNMRKGWYQDASGQWYFLASSGEMQTGLIVIDGKTYFLNPSGEMFLGEKTVNGTTFNFGMYGTTNGQAYISNKWLGNGDKIQMPAGTGGGSGSGGSGKYTPTTEEKIDKVNDTVNSKVEEINKVEGITARFDEEAQEVSVKIVGEKAESGAETVKSTVLNVVTSTIKQADVNSEAVCVLPTGTSVTMTKVNNSSVSIGGVTKSTGEWIDQYLGDKNLSDLGGSSAVTVIIDGEEVTYDISVIIE